MDLKIWLILIGYVGTAYIALQSIEKQKRNLVIHFTQVEVCFRVKDGLILCNFEFGRFNTSVINSTVTQFYGLLERSR